MSTLSLVFLIATLAAFVLIFKGVKIVPQSQNFVVERFGKYQRTLTAGLNFIIPFLDRVEHKLNILEQQSPQSPHDVITKDNVQISISTTIYYKIIDAANATYRITDLVLALNNAVTGTVRSIIGSIDFDEVQSHRDKINSDIRESLGKACKDWGIEVMRTEILDVDVDENTKTAMQQQINAERTRRAEVMKAEGIKKSKELMADAEFYTAKKEAEAKKVLADADAYATTTIAKAINDGGGKAIEFEILKRQVKAASEIASSDNSKLIVLPNEFIKALDSVKGIFGK
jgi:regulator of protease activity HflC (stomatin/prohibitin superfamily)